MAQITLRDYLQEIEDALKSKRTEEALAKSQRALEHFPESLEAQRLLGEVYLAQGQMEEAQQAFDWVLTNDPENVIAYCDRALISEREADYETALDCYQQAYELSKGNSSIRELFNALSVRTGQQGFMFSRAGLARLYMRGDLLSQSIQEWETVLAAMPDRLDARVGLLETYWREGSYDKVDELSRQILNDVPGCLKALLLQSYVTSPRDMLEAQDIMRRAEMLDPDLMMAQDLFSDLITSQASNPFLKLIRKKPATLESANGKVATPPVADSKDYAQVTPEALLNANVPNEVLANWSDLDEWNGIDTFKPRLSQLPTQPEPSLPTLTTWTPETSDPWQALNSQQPAASNAQPNVDAWESPDRNSEQPQGFQFDAWQVSASNPVDLTTPTPPHPPTPEHKPWEGSEDATYTAPNFDDLNSWNNFNTLQSEDAGNTWSSGSSSNDAMSATPAWLNMLTQADQHQPSLPAMPAEPPVARQPAIEPPAPVAPPQQTVPVAPAPEPDLLPLWDVEPALSSFSGDGEEEFSFGPEWLKSLGAASINEEEKTPVVAEPEQPVSAPAPVVAKEPVAPPAPLPTVPTPPAPEPQPASDPWATSAPAPSFGEPADASLLATLEDLEQTLRARGFVPHAPNTLSVIAQSQPSPAPTAEPVAQQEAVPYELSDLTSALAHQRAALSSALEQLGSLNEQYQSTPAQPTWSAPEPSPAQPAGSAPTPAASPVWSSPEAEPAPAAWSAPVAEPAQPVWSAPASEPAAPLEEPAWVAALRAVPAPPPLQEQPFYKDGAPTLVPPVYVPPTYTPPAPLDTPLAPAAHVNTYAGPLYQPQPAPVPEPIWGQQTGQQSTPTEHAPDNELEMTMKRPALRLPLTPQPQPPSRERMSDATETISTVGKIRSSASKDAPLSARDRLLKGYQHQQVGDYDEAMQEYRFLIRNVPDLLTEVINNLRALLKSAPRYASGYRVLGDAYMRQGEYLQAMESYNKALTMAKKARA